MSRLHPGTPHHRFRSWAVASVLACNSWWAQAVSLGPVSVSSAIGQPLRASIAITQFKVEDLRQLQVRLADAASFQQAGITIHPALNGLQVSLAFRGNGEPVIALVGQVPVAENFLDLIVEAQWPSGRLAMNYTLLVSPAGALPDSATPVMSPAVDPQALKAQTVAAQSLATADNATLTVRAGDTALKLVLAQRLAGVSLAQMLVAMVRANPEAFIEGNVNLLREGAQIQMPSVQEAAQISADEARQTVLAQNADFANYARRLAQSALKAQGSASREITGLVKPAAQTTATSPAGQDKLTLSQRAITSNSDEARWAVEQEIKEKTAQLAALKKSLNDLQTLAAKTSTPDTSTSTSSTQTKQTSNVPAAPATQAAQTSPLSAEGSANPMTASAPSPHAAPSLMAQVSQHPTLWVWMAGLLAAMVGLAIGVRRRHAQRVDFFGANNAPNSATPMPSGLPAQFAKIDLNLTPTPEADQSASAPRHPL
jgi:pilus assembly protein FimV